MASIPGTNNSEILGPGGAVTVPGGGTDTGTNDTITGANGNDTIFGGNGVDSLLGENGNDLLFGGDGNDSLFGGADSDRLEGGAGADLLRGNSPGSGGGGGRDTVSYAGSTAPVSVTINGSGTGGDAQGDILQNIEDLIGSAFNDTLTGDVDDNIIEGGAGNDLLYGAGGTDALYGDAGNDTLFGGTGGDSLFGGSDFDFADYSANTGGFTANLAVGPATVNADGTDTLSGVEGVIGGSGNDAMFGGGADNWFIGNGGNDTLSGGSGNDTLSGGVGADSINGGQGQDYVDYSASNAAVYVHLETASIFGGHAGNSTLDRDTLTGIDGIIGSDFNDTLIGFDGQGTSGDIYTNIFFGGRGNDVMDGRAGNDQLFGGADNDSIVGGDGSDLLSGGDGGDSLFGGTGIDSLSGDAGDDLIFGGDSGDRLEGGDGNDSLYGDSGNGAFADTIFGGGNDDYVEGGGGADSLFGGDGNDSMDGQSGADSLDGGGGNDVLAGGDNDDLLTGGLGDDTIFGGAGRDSLFGDVGNDVFDYIVGDVTTATGIEFVDGGGEPIPSTGIPDPDDFDTLDLRAYGSAFGWRQVVIQYDGNNPATEAGTVLLYADAAQTVLLGTIDFEEIENFLICFTPGTMILTDQGERPVQDLVAGDLVMTRDHGLQPLRWVGHRRLSRSQLVADPDLQPVRIARGALGGEGPARSMMVSPQHRVLVTGARAELLFAEDEVLVPAKHLIGQAEVTRALPEEGVTYIHILFDRHEIVQSDGIWTESFQPAERSLNAMEAAVRDEILKLFPELATDTGGYEAARLSLKAFEARVLFAR